MGCTSNPEEDRIKKHQMLIELRDTIINLISNNPFYNINIKDYRKFMHNLKSEIEGDLTKEDILDKTIEKYFNNRSNMDIYIYKSVVELSLKYFSIIFKGDHEIIPLIFNILFVFLTQKQKGIKKEMKKDIYLIFDKIKLEIKLTEDGGKIKFKSGEFCFLILNLIQFCSFSFLNFFCGPATLEHSGIYSKNEINLIFSNDDKPKEFLPENINKIVNEYLYNINEIITPKYVNKKTLTKVLQPISDYINENKDEEYFWIDMEKMEDIFDSLIDKMDYEYYIDLFFNDE